MSQCGNIHILKKSVAYSYYPRPYKEENKNIIAGFFNPYDGIRIAEIGKPTNIAKEYLDSITLENTIIHESIHSVLYDLIGMKASLEFDNLAYPNKLNLGTVLEKV